jgi:phosphate transport system substrate-binding protein
MIVRSFRQLGFVRLVICGLGVAMASGCLKPAAPPTPTATAGGKVVATDDNGGKPAETVAATEALINVEGSSTVYLISQAFAVEFEKSTKHKVSVGRSGTGGGYKKFALRQSDIWNASRPIADKEIAELKEKGIDWLELTVGIDGLSIAVHPENDWCPGLSVADLKKLWQPDSKIAKWSDLNPQWPEQPIQLFGADSDSGTFEYFTEVIVGKKGSTRTDYTPASDDNILVQGVSGNKFALGYIPHGYCEENKDKIKVIGVSPTKDASETAAPFVITTTETILSGEYSPLSRPLFEYANKEALKRSEVVKFLEFSISEVAQPLVAKRGFVRMTDATRKEMEERLAAALKSAEPTETK